MPDDVKPQPEQQPVEQSPDNQSAPEPTARPALEQAENHPAMPKTPQQHEEHHLIPIVLAIVLLIILAAIAIIGGDKINRQNTSENGSTAQSVQAPQQANQPSAQSQDRQTLNDAVKSINSLSTDEDTSGQNLSDQNLGL